MRDTVIVTTNNKSKGHKKQGHKKHKNNRSKRVSFRDELRIALGLWNNQLSQYTQGKRKNPPVAPSKRVFRRAIRTFGTIENLYDGISSGKFVGISISAWFGPLWSQNNPRVGQVLKKYEGLAKAAGEDPLLMQALMNL